MKSTKSLIKWTLVLTSIGASILPVTANSQLQFSGRPETNAARNYLVQFGPSVNQTSYIKESKIGIWRLLRKGEMTKFPELSSDDLQTHLGSMLILIDGNALEYRAILVQEVRYPSEQPNEGFLKGFTAAKAEPKTAKAPSTGMTEQQMSDYIDEINAHPPADSYRDFLYPKIQPWFHAFRSAKGGLISAEAWGEDNKKNTYAFVLSSYFTDVSAFNDRLKKAQDSLSDVANQTNYPQVRNAALLAKFREAIKKALEGLEEVQGLVGTAIALAPDDKFEEAIKDDSQRAVFESTLDEMLIPNVNVVTIPPGGKRVFKVKLEPRNDDLNLPKYTLTSPAYDQPKWYSLNTAGPFFYKLSTFNYATRQKDPNDATKGFELFEQGVQETKKSTIGAFYSQMYAASDFLHYGLSVGVLVSEDSRIGYALGVTARLGGSNAFFLTAGQMYAPYGAAKYAPGTVFGTQAEADAAKTMSMNSFQWRPFIGLAIKF